LKRSSTQKGKFHFKDCSPLGLAPLGSGRGERVPNLTGTCSHFWPDRLGVEGVLPPCSLLGHVTGPRRLQDHSRRAVLLMHAQWVSGCEAASYHSRVPTLKMRASWNTGWPVK
ncbi:unnamed protein product, partial [Staurois parvus]